MSDEDSCALLQFREAGFASACEYVRSFSDVCEGGGYIPWTELHVCAAEGQSTQILIFVLSIVFFMYLFVVLTVTADDFFCTNIAVIIDQHKISESVSGITFMAFGNGAPDIFSSIASVMSVKNPQAGLAISELLGADIFVTSIVVATIIFAKPFDVMRRPVIRDIFFYLVSLSFLVFIVLYDNQVYLWQAVVFLLLYLVYAMTVVWSININKRMLKGEHVTNVKMIKRIIDLLPVRGRTEVYSIDGNDLTMPAVVNGNKIVSRPIDANDPNNIHTNLYGTFATDVQNEFGREKGYDKSTNGLMNGNKEGFHAHFVELCQRLNPVNVKEFTTSNWLGKAYAILKIPCTIVLSVSCPLAAQEWSQLLTVLHIILAPMLFCAAFQLFDVIQGPVAIWMIVLGVSALSSVCVLIFTKHNIEPRYYKKFSAYAGFLMSIAWMYAAAAEVMNVVVSLGNVFGVSSQILGLTAVAWCNSIGDLVADYSVAKQGFPRMAFSAAIGTPLFNLLVGFGATFTIAKLQGKIVSIEMDGVKATMFITLAVGLMSTLMFLFMTSFHTRKLHAVYLIVLYVVFIVVALILNSGIVGW
ncbi:sodium/calcium exchanger protein [Ditylenchus destructor]|nr:sodium/calcium exchanger protein [Ditylenchus destructor]